MSQFVARARLAALSDSMNDKNKLAEDRTDWAEDRTILANERTFAGWMRTSMTSLVVAIGLKALFSDFEPTWLAKAVASVFVIMSVYIIWTAHQTATKALERLNTHNAEAITNGRLKTLAIIFSVASVAVGATLWMI